MCIPAKIKISDSCMISQIIYSKKAQGNSDLRCYANIIELCS